MQHVLVQAGLVPAVDVSNSPGAGGVIGLAQFVTAERGRGDCLLVSGLAMVSALRTNHAAVSLAEATPIARLTGDYEVIAVPATSELRDFDDLVQALRVQPGAVSWAGGSGGGVDQILVSALARAIGVDPVHMDYVPFAGGGEVADALVSHEVSVGVSGYAELAPLVVAGRLRMLAISSAARLPGLDVPTLREQGVDVVLLNWRGIFAPPGITAEQKDRLESLVAAMVELPGWRKTLAQRRWIDLYLPEQPFAHFLAMETARAAALPDPRGTHAAQDAGPVWTRDMWMLRNGRLLLSLLGLAAASAVAFIAWQRATATRREQEMTHDVEVARQDASLRIAEAESLLRGVGEQIDRQFEEWDLTAAEQEVALLMLKGLRHKEIASVRDTSERTVRQQALAIYKKAGLDGRTDLAAFFLEDLLQPAKPAPGQVNDPPSVTSGRAAGPVPATLRKAR